MGIGAEELTRPSPRWSGPGPGPWLAAVASLALLSGCANTPLKSHTEQITSSTQVQTARVSMRDLQGGGIAFITPGSITGQEEDRQALALAFTEKMRAARPDLRCVTLSETISAINRAGLASEYKRMFEDSRLTGVFDREMLKKVADVTGARYLVQLKLGGFRQEAKGRWGLLGIRLLETKATTIRLFMQMWDGRDGAVVWEGSQELTIAYESIAEESISMQKAVEASARELLIKLPEAALADSTSPGPSPGGEALPSSSPGARPLPIQASAQVSAASRDGASSPVQ